MALNLFTLFGKIALDDKEVNGGLDKVNQKAKETEGGLNKLTNGFGTLGKVAGGFVLGSGILNAPSFLFSAAEAAAEDAAVMGRLQTAIENTGVSFDDYADTIDDVIKNGQRLGFSDDQTRGGLAILAAQTSDTEEALKRYALAQDLARGANIDVVAASRLLGKVTEENVTVLNRYGITVKEGATETELFAAIQQKFGGQAEKFAEGPAGKMAQLRDRIGELKEGIGAGLIPVLSAATSVAVKVFPLIEKGVELIAGGLQRGAQLVAGFLGPVEETFGAFLKYIQLVISDGDTLNDWLTHLPGPLQTIAQAIGEVINLFRDGEVFRNVAGSIADVLLPVLRDTIAIWAALISNTIEVIAALAKWAVEVGLVEAAMIGLKTIVQAVGGVLQVLIPIVSSVIKFLTDNKIAAIALAAAFGIFVAAVAPVPVAIIAIVTAVGLLRQAWDALKAKTEEIWNSLPGPVRAFLEFIGGYVYTRIKAVIDQIINIFNAFVDAVQLVMALLRGDWERAWEEIKSIAGRIVDGIVNQIRIQFGNIPEAVLQGLGDLSNLLYKAGQDLINGLIRGVESKVGELKQKVGSLVEDAKSLVTSGFGIFSPSRVFREYGEQLMAGFQGGIAQGFQRQVQPALGQVIADINRRMSAVMSVMANLAAYIAGPHGLAANPERVADYVGNAQQTISELLAGGVGTVFEDFSFKVKRVVDLNSLVGLPDPSQIAQAGGSGLSLTFPNAQINVTPDDNFDLERLAGDVGFAVQSDLRSRGVLVAS